MARGLVSLHFADSKAAFFSRFLIDMLFVISQTWTLSCYVLCGISTILTFLRIFIIGFYTFCDFVHDFLQTNLFALPFKFDRICCFFWISSHIRHFLGASFDMCLRSLFCFSVLLLVFKTWAFGHFTYIFVSYWSLSQPKVAFLVHSILILFLFCTQTVQKLCHCIDTVNLLVLPSGAILHSNFMADECQNYSIYEGTLEIFAIWATSVCMEGALIEDLQ